MTVEQSVLIIYKEIYSFVDILGDDALLYTTEW